MIALGIAKGQAKKATGALTDYEGKKAEGRKDQIKGAAKGGERPYEEPLQLDSNTQTLAKYRIL